MLISYNDKYTVKVGEPGNLLALVPKSKVGWMATNAEARAEDHDVFVKSNVVPTVCFLIDTPDNFNLGNFWKR